MSTSAMAAVSPAELTLDDGARVAVIGGGPAGSLFAYFLLEMANRVSTAVHVDLYEPRNFTQPGAGGCNMCGGIISETLVQNLAVEGVDLPSGVIQRGIESYVLHMDVGSTRIETPLAEMRIGAVHRGAGPRDLKNARFQSFDHHLQARAVAAGARAVSKRVERVERVAGKPVVRTKDGAGESYDLLVVASGVNSPLLKSFAELGIGYEPPAVTKTVIREYYLGGDVIERTLGSSMHVFLLDIPRLEFAAIIPKGDYVTLAILGEDIDKELVEAFVSSPEVRACMPADWNAGAPSCQCMPCINVRGVSKPYADRVVFIGDCGVTRLYKDGIGAAYRTAKSAARTVLFEGIHEGAFERHFMPVCRSIANDNAIGKVAFLFTRLARRLRVLRRGMLRMVVGEQKRPGEERRLSSVLWDMFSGSAPYADIFMRMLRPAFLVRFIGSVAASIVARRAPPAALPTPLPSVAAGAVISVPNPAATVAPDVVLLSRRIRADDVPQPSTDGAAATAAPARVGAPPTRGQETTP